MKPKILLFDLETSPNLGWTWGKYEQDVISFKEQSFILSFSAKWLGGAQITRGLCDYPNYNRNKHDDSSLVRELWKLFDDAEVLVAHNGDRFDIKKANARFAFFDLRPPSPYKKIDTLKIARKYYSFNSNRLDDLGDYLKLGRKQHHEGFGLWQKCMEGDLEAWKKMKKYNAQDTLLLEKLYYRFLPYIENHPAAKMRENPYGKCPNCGEKKLHSRGFEWVRNVRYKKFQCHGCGKWQVSKIKA
jgi:hypothetical protein